MSLRKPSFSSQLPSLEEEFIFMEVAARLLRAHMVTKTPERDCQPDEIYAPHDERLADRDLSFLYRNILRQFELLLSRELDTELFREVTSLFFIFRLWGATIGAIGPTFRVLKSDEPEGALFLLSRLNDFHYALKRLESSSVLPNTGLNAAQIENVNKCLWSILHNLSELGEPIQQSVQLHLGAGPAAQVRDAPMARWKQSASSSTILTQHDTTILINRWGRSARVPSATSTQNNTMPRSNDQRTDNYKEAKTGVEPILQSPDHLPLTSIKLEFADGEISLTMQRSNGRNDRPEQSTMTLCCTMPPDWYFICKQADTSTVNVDSPGHQRQSGLHVFLSKFLNFSPASKTRLMD